MTSSGSTWLRSPHRTISAIRRLILPLNSCSRWCRSYRRPVARQQVERSCRTAVAPHSAVMEEYAMPSPLTVPPRSFHRGLLYAPVVTDLDAFDAHIAFLGIPY